MAIRLRLQAIPAFLPAPRAVLALALAAPAALVLAAFAPGLWIVAPALGGALSVLVLLDALFAGTLADLRVIVPADAEVGEPLRMSVLAELARAGARARPVVALALDPRLLKGGRLELALQPTPGGWQGNAELRPLLRGTAAVSRVWLRWRGPLGLAERMVARPLDLTIRVRPSLAPLRSPALQLFLRDSSFGLVARRIRGEGTEFEALADYEPGMDRRRIDWKSSARHARLFAREYETERNNQIVFAFDCGQAMCEPVAGVSRLDRAITAGLTTAWVALKAQDRIALFGFAARPQVLTPFITASRDFARLQQAAASLDYRAEEPNFTLAIATLTARLQRRSLVVIFSEFTDPTSAEMMIETVRRLVDRHVVVFVVLADAELTGLAGATVDSVHDAAMAVAAGSLQRQRALVLQRLRHLGVRVIEAPYDVVGTRLLDTYLAIKREGAIG
ncbi:DUF58 domain-containing protein [Novosphingobium sp. FKTRR1]|uniref:DUF58 domain-containing protein n=1 Tax=Novosphingobium sp. FKTRR1 TaxID=2879118 RepID=UPI00351CC6A1